MAVTTPDTVEAQEATLYVGGTGEGNYTTIQSAIDAANVDDTIFVYNGTYFEMIFVTKSLQLLGEHMNTTVIDGAGNSHAVIVEANWVTMSSFSVTNATNSGIVLDSSEGSVISDNNISGNHGGGIDLIYSPFNTITNNIIVNHDSQAIYAFESEGGLNLVPRHQTG